jgi:hypothetical protein
VIGRPAAVAAARLWYLPAPLELVFTGVTAAFCCAMVGAVVQRQAFPTCASVVDRRACDEVQPAEGCCGRQDAGDVRVDWREGSLCVGQEHSGNAVPGLGDDGGGTQVFRWQATLG